MNERLKELAERATEYANEQNELYGVGYVITFKEKFAELLVRECARVAFATAIGDGTPDEIYDAIKETFRS